MTETTEELAHDRRNVMFSDGQHRTVVKAPVAVMNRFTFVNRVFHHDSGFSWKLHSMTMVGGITHLKI